MKQSRRGQNRAKFIKKTRRASGFRKNRESRHKNLRLLSHLVSPPGRASADRARHTFLDPADAAMKARVSTRHTDSTDERWTLAGLVREGRVGSEDEKRARDDAILSRTGYAVLASGTTQDSPTSSSARTNRSMRFLGPTLCMT